MNVQEQKGPRRVRRRSVAMASGAVVDARSDADVAQMDAVEAKARAAQRQSMAATAAYFLAEKRGFEPGHELDDWLAAEAGIADMELPSVVTSIQLSGAGSAS